jgi:hypothetical protein
MPTANLNAAVPTGVLPQTLSTAFSESREFPMLSKVYHDGTTERSLITDGVNNPRSIRTWKLTKRLTTVDLEALKSFYDAHQGGVIPFYFYDPFTEGEAIGSTYDATGDSETGRYTVKFINPTWQQEMTIHLTNSAISFMEVA